jgi:hypothetical protein
MNAIHITAHQLGTRWGIDPKVLCTWRCEGIGPSYLKLGSGRIIYRLSDIEAYESACYNVMPGTVRAIATIAGSTQVSRETGIQIAGTLQNS